MTEIESEFDKLPIEMQRKLFSFLAYEDNVLARQVCGLWWELVDENLSFNVILNNDNLDFVKNLSRPIETLTVVNLTKEMIRDDANDDEDRHPIVNSSVSHLALGQWVKSSTSKCSIITEDNVMTLLTTLSPQLQSLTVFPEQLAVKDMTLFHKISLPRLTKLDIVVRRVDVMDTFMSLLKLNMTSLQWLRIDWEKIYLNNVEKMLSLYKEIYNFVAAHSDSLKIIHLILPFHWIDRPRNGEGSSRTVKEDEEERLKIANKLEDVQLNEITLQGLPVEGSKTFNLGIPLLSSQKWLTKVRLHDFKVGYYKKLKTLFSHCGSTLTLIWIEGASLGVHSYGPFSCTLVQPCTNLQTLVINNPQITHLTHIEALPKSLKVLSLKMPIDGSVVYPWISGNLFHLKELTIRPTLWNVNAVMDLSSFKNFLGLPSLLKLNLSDGLFESQTILQFVDVTPGLRTVSASYCWPDLVNLYVLIDRSVYKHFY